MPRPPPRGARGGVSPPSKVRRERRFEVDRIVLLRVALAVLVILFLYLVVRVGIVAFGGGGASQAKRIERVVDEATAAKLAAPAAKPGEAPAR